MSRQTIRHALRELRARGIITAARGRLSRVRSLPHLGGSVDAPHSTVSSVEATGLEQRTVVRCLDVRTAPEVSERLGRDESTRLVYLERLWFVDAEPLAYERVWLPAELTESLLAVDFTHAALYDGLASRCGIRLTGGDELVRAVVPNEPERELLRIPADIAAFAVERLGEVDGEPVEYRISLVRGDRFGALAHVGGQPACRSRPGAVRGTSGG